MTQNEGFVGLDDASLKFTCLSVKLAPTLRFSIHLLIIPNCKANWAIQAQINAAPKMQRRTKTLRSISEIGLVLFAILIGEMPEMSTVGDKQMTALAGVAPINNDSGRTEGKRSIWNCHDLVPCP